MVRDFARTQKLRLVEVNLELNPHVRDAFLSRNPDDILKALSFLGYSVTDPKKDLLFIDEIQESPEAIVALRYFYEMRPELAVVATGSLLEFAFEAKEFSMPVGRVEFLWIHPMNFHEYLQARGKSSLAEEISSFQIGAGLWSPIAHRAALEELRSYLFCGGMPQALQAMAENHDSQACRRSHLSILQSYRQDFYKYAKRIKVPIAERLFLKAPGLVGGRFKFSHIDPDYRASEIKPAVEALEKAGVVRRVFHSAGQGLPLATDCNERIAKLFFLDVGLMHASLQIEPELVKEKDLLAIHRGAVAEQFVAQELLATTAMGLPGDLYFWVREALNSQAEVDFLVASGSKVIPVEVKSGASGTLKSLRSFMESHPASNRAVRLYSGMPEESESITHLPLYMAGCIQRNIAI
jgi:predicted AAA+ superfamily ATPase